ncbi:MAG: replicative DNA helicase, partial [Rhodocyclaceae bacterium]
RGLAEVDIAKQRNGPTGKVTIRFASSYTRFDNLQPGEGPPEEEDEGR